MKYIDDDIVADLYFGHMKPEELPEWVNTYLHLKSDAEMALKQGKETYGWDAQGCLDGLSKCLVISSVENGLITWDELPKLARDAMARVVLPSGEELQRYFDDSVAAANKDYVGYMFMVSTPPSGKDCGWDREDEFKWYDELYNSCIYFNRQYVEWCYVVGQDEMKYRMCNIPFSFTHGEGFYVPVRDIPYVLP